MREPSPVVWRGTRRHAQRRGLKAGATASFKLGVGACEPVHAHCMGSPQRGHSMRAALPSSGVSIQRSTFCWQPGV